MASTSTPDDDEETTSASHVAADDPFGLRLAQSGRTTVANERERIALENDVSVRCGKVANFLLQENDRLLKDVQPRDMINYGLIPEFVGRFPVIVPFVNTTEEMLVQILVQPANSLLKQYQQQFKYDGVSSLRHSPECRMSDRAALHRGRAVGDRSSRLEGEDGRALVTRGHRGDPH